MPVPQAVSPRESWPIRAAAVPRPAGLLLTYECPLALDRGSQDLVCSTLLLLGDQLPSAVRKADQGWPQWTPPHGHKPCAQPSGGASQPHQACPTQDAPVMVGAEETDWWVRGGLWVGKGSVRMHQKIPKALVPSPTPLLAPGPCWARKPGTPGAEVAIVRNQQRQNPKQRVKGAGGLAPGWGCWVWVGTLGWVQRLRAPLAAKSSPQPHPGSPQASCSVMERGTLESGVPTRSPVWVSVQTTQDPLSPWAGRASSLPASGWPADTWMPYFPAWLWVLGWPRSWEGGPGMFMANLKLLLASRSPGPAGCLWRGMSTWGSSLPPPPPTAVTLSLGAAWADGAPPSRRRLGPKHVPHLLKGWTGGSSVGDLLIQGPSGGS